MPLVSAPSITQTSGGQNLYAVAGSTGPGGGVTQLIAGTNVTLDPVDGLGVVTVNAAGGGGITSVVGYGNGINVNTIGTAVSVQNSGVTQLTAGTGISLSGSTGNLTVSASQTTGATFGPTSAPLAYQIINTGGSGTVNGNATLNVYSTITSTFGTLLFGQMMNIADTATGGSIGFNLTSSLTALGIVGPNTAATLDTVDGRGCHIVTRSSGGGAGPVVNSLWTTYTDGRVILSFVGTPISSGIVPEGLYNFSIYYLAPLTQTPPLPPNAP